MLPDSSRPHLRSSPQSSPPALPHATYYAPQTTMPILYIPFSTLQTLSLLLLLLVSPVYAIPFLSRQPRSLAKQGPEGDLDPLIRLRDTVGTALRIHGPAAQYDIRSALRDGPLSSVYRSALLSPNASDVCEPGRDQDCAVAVNGFGTVGEVRYNSSLFSQKLSARSTQVMIGCRCLSIECGEAVLIRPINVISKETNTRRGSLCLYERVEGKFSECHAEMLRVSYKDEDTLPFEHGSDYFQYHSNGVDEEWWAVGQRAWTRDCYEDQVASFAKVNVSAIQQSDIAFNVHKTLPNNSCSAPEGVEYVVSDSDDDGKECALLFQYAASGGAQRGTQQDAIATGGQATTYMTEKPELISNTEVALVCSAAGLGFLFVWGLYRKQMKRTGGSWRGLGLVVLKQILGYGLEALPLHTALGSEIMAGKWRSLFAFMDATLAVANATTAVQGDVNGSVLVLTGLVGEVRYMRTREWLMWFLAVLFDVVVVVVMIATVLRKGRRIMAGDHPPGYKNAVGAWNRGKTVIRSGTPGKGGKGQGRVRRRWRRGMSGGLARWSGKEEHLRREDESGNMEWSSGSLTLTLSPTSTRSLCGPWSTSSSPCSSFGFENEGNRETGVGEVNIEEANTAMVNTAEVSVAEAHTKEATTGEANTVEENMAHARANAREEEIGKSNTATASIAEPNIVQETMLHAKANAGEARIGKSNIANANLAKASIGKAKSAKVKTAEAKTGETETAKAINTARANIVGANPAELIIGKTNTAEGYVAEAKTGDMDIAQNNNGGANTEEVNPAKVNTGEASTGKANTGGGSIGKAKDGSGEWSKR